MYARPELMYGTHIVIKTNKKKTQENSSNILISNSFVFMSLFLSFKVSLENYQWQKFVFLFFFIWRGLESRKGREWVFCTGFFMAMVFAFERMCDIQKWQDYKNNWNQRCSLSLSLSQNVDTRFFVYSKWNLWTVFQGINSKLYKLTSFT